MTDYTQLANEAKARAADEPRSDPKQILLFGKSPTEEMTENIEALADALLTCQAERDRLAAEVERFAVQESAAFDLLADINHEGMSDAWQVKARKWRQKYYTRIGG